MSNDTTNRYISQVVLPPKEEGDTERLYLIKDQKAQDNIELLQSNLTSLDTELDMLDTKIDNIDIPNISNLVSTDDLTNTVSGLISKKETNDNYVTWSSLLTYYSNNTTLNNNYAHITDGIIDNATINHEDVNGLSENYAHVDNNYIIDNATINHENVNGLYENYAHVNNGIINNATISYTNINDLDGNYAHVTDGVIDNATISYININDLDGNYARVINGIIIDANIDYTRINNLNDNYAHITGGLIDNASIRYTNIEDLDDNYAHVTDGIIDNANIDYAHINNLDANYAHITNGVIDNAYIDQAKVNNLDANYAHIQNGVIDNANIDQANINNLDANYAHITNGTIDNANISYANVSNLNAHYAHLEDGVIDNALIGYANVDQLDSHYAEIDMANVNNAWIENGVIRDAAITDAKIFGVSANKLTAGRIDASNINVINLRADNLIVTKINGQPVIGGYTLVSPEISGYIDKNPSQENWYEFYNNLYTLTIDTFVDPNKNYYTTSDSVELYDQTTIDSMFEDVNARIDSQIETWTVDELPTLMNYPAENWTTNDLKDAHIGDICYVVNASNDYNGFTYRFAYDNTSHQYSWVLIQDNQVTAALGRITQLETFNNQLVNWEDATDEGVITVRGRFTELSGRIDKTVKSSIQLWYTKANTTAPSAPISQVTSTSTNGGAWTTVVPIYNENYPNYFYCWQYQYEDNTYGWSAVIYDQATTETQEAARTVPPDLLDYISDNIETIQEQVLDGQLEIWYGSANPSLNNTPANEWTSDKYEDHVGDLYYNTTDGSVWQWTENNSTYSWTEIPDSAASTALAAAQSAQATADGKRKIFTTTPTVPYDIGDLWVTGSTVKYANVAKTSSQTYNENDWSLTATDDTTANANIKSSIQLWYTSNSTTPPSKPYTDGSSNHITSTSTSGNTWTTVVPIYNSSTSKYHYCYQQQRGDGTYQWTTPVYDDATTTAMAKAQSALPVSTFETFEQTTFKEVTDTIDTQQSTITQLQTKTERALSQGVEYIVGTHGTTATNVWTGVTQDEQLYAGKQIAFYMTSAGVSGSAATLNLQLSDETWSGPINVKINDTNVTDQYPINTVLRLTYDGGAWKSDNYNSDTNYYDREAYKANVTANGAISAGRIGVFGTDGKLKLLSNSAFDTSYPILYIGTAYTANALTQTNNYTFWGTPFNLTNTHSIVGAAAGKPVYIVGTLNGNVMTPTTNVLTCTIPTEADNLFYIRLGLMSSTTNAVLESQHPIYAFIDGAFQQTTKSVITISNTVNTVRQTADTNSAKISNLTQTLGTNADGTTAADDIVHQISEIDQNLDGISTRVSKTEVSLRGTFATSSTAANTAAKTATIFPENNDFKLYTGATITVKFTNNNTASAPTLNINSTGAKPIKTYSGANLSEAEYQWDAGSTMNFVYDGTNWCIQDSTELTRLKNNESRITQTANSITSLVANNETYTAPDGTTKTNTIRSAIKQNADNIDLRVEKANVIASINASVETDGTSAVKISADKVNVEGAAIFNSGRLSTTNLDNAYDSKGSASAAQTAAINAAAADATQKANDAQSAAEATASADATQKANAAQSAAEATAAADATSKANAARDAAISAAATDATNKVNAVNKQEQLIYIQAVSGTLSIPDNKKPTTWVTSVAESVSSDTAGLTPVWTTKHPTYRSNYPVLFVATQRQTVGGTLTCTTPLKDDTTTIIDGGHITTGTIDATQVNVTNIDASEIKTGTLAANRIESKSLTIDKFTDEDQADILNSHIGQPNLIPFFSFDLTDIYHSTNNPNGYWYANSATPTGPNATWNSCWTQLENGWVHIEKSNSGSSTIGYYASSNVTTDMFIESGKTYTILTEMRNCIGEPANIYASTGAADTRLPSGVNQVSNYSSGSYIHYDILTAKDATGTTPSRPFNFRIQLAAGKSFSCDVRVSLYEGEYGGPYKPYVDQTLSNRVKSAETSIEQNAEAITLRATKTETTVGGRNLLSGDAAMVHKWTNSMPSAVTVTGEEYEALYHMIKGIGGWENVYSPAIHVETGKTYTVSMDYSVESDYTPYGPSDQRMFGLEVCTKSGSTSNDFSSLLAKIPFGVSAKERTRGSATFTATVDTIYLHLDGGYIKDGMENKDFVVSRLKLEEGSTATAYMAPYSDYATSAELKVANDNINLKVSKNDVINQINVSTEGAKIQASKVEIDGTAVFNAAKSKLDAAYDAKGAATTAENNAKAYTDALEIGGRNLLQDSDQVLENGSVLDTKTLFNCFLWSTPAKSYTGYKQIMPYTNVNSAGRFVLTFEAMNISQEYWCIKHNGTQHDYARYFKNSVDVEQGDVLTLSFDVVKFNPSVANGLEIKNFKLERGNKATDWSPAPEDVDSAIEQSVAGQGGFTILWNYEKFATANNGEGYICALDPTTGTKSDADGWIMWNGVKRTIPKGMINPNAVHPYNTPCYIVCRLSSADATTGTNYIVSYNSGWKGGVINAGALSDWTWNEATDIIIGKYVETASEAAFVEMEIYNPPLSSKQITTQNITASRANDTATTANNKLVAFRGVCSTAAGTAAKVVSCTGFALTQGYSITVYNTTDNTSAAKLTLNVNSLGAKDVWVAGAVTSDTNRLLWKAGSTITFVYDGTQFRVADSPASLYGTTCTIAEGTAAKTTTANDCVIFKGTQITVPMSNSNTATTPTLNISSLGATNIYHGSGTTGPTKANGYAWPATAAVIFTYDGKFWRFGNQTFIDGGNILTGTIAADRIKANVISAVNDGTGTIDADRINVSQIQIGKLSGVSDYSTTSQMNAAISESIDQTYIQNLTPYFQMDMSNEVDEYWTNLTVSRKVDNEDISVFTKLDDGWAHFECTNTGTSTLPNYIRQRTIETLIPGNKYTLLVEFRNVSINIDGGSFYSQQGDYYQIWGTETYGGFSISNATIRALPNGSGIFYKTLTLLDADSKDLSGTVRGKLPKAHFMSINQQVTAGQTISYDVRISLYEDGYTGPYKPYVGPQLYASGTDVSDLTTSLADTNKSIQETNESLNGALDTIDELKQDQGNMGRWLTFNENDALTIGKTDSEFKVVMNEERQAFMYGDDTLAYTSGDRFVAPRMEADEMHIGNWMWVKRNNGNLSLKWIG